MILEALADDPVQKKPRASKKAAEPLDSEEEELKRLKVRSVRDRPWTSMS